MVEMNYVDKINKLLRKAESTTDAEAEALIVKAQTLMTQFAITEAMLEAQRTGNKPDEIIRIEIPFTGIYQRTLFDLGFSVANVNGCRSLIHKRTYTKPTATIQTVVGFESDVKRVELLASSLQIQAIAAMKSWWKGQDSSWMSNMEKFKERREFLEGFKNGVSRKLRTAKAAAEQEFDDSISTGSVENVVNDEDIVIAPGTTSAIVLRGRKERVDTWMDDTYGKLRKSRGGSRSYGSFGASDSGRAAGSRADIGLTRIGNQRKALG